MRTTRAIGLLFAVSGIMSSVQAAVPKNALGAIAISPDGAMLVAAGDNRALYVLDPVSLEVKQRVSIGINPQEAFFTKDGATLAIYDEDGDMHIYSVADWSEKAVVKDGEAMAVSPAADTFVTLAYPTSSGGTYATPFAIYSMIDGSKKLEGSIVGQAKSIAAAPDGSSYVVLIARQEDANEAKTATPADLKDLAKLEFEKKNDGSTSQVVKLDSAGKELSRVTTWYSTYETLRGVANADAAWLLGYSNQNLRVGNDGSIQLFVLAPSYLYGMGFAPDGAKVAAGSLRDGTIYNFADGAAVTYELDETPSGFPEYLVGFTFAPDGSAYVGTTAYRLAHIGADGKIIAVKPVF